MKIFDTDIFKCSVLFSSSFILDTTQTNIHKSYFVLFNFKKKKRDSGKNILFKLTFLKIENLSYNY